MLKKFKLLPVFVLITFQISAQQTNKNQYAFSLQQAVDFAIKNQVSVKNAELDKKIAKEKSDELLGIGLPQISGSADITKFIDIPTTFVPGEFFGGDPGSFYPVQFGQNYSSTAGLTASQLLFDGSYLVGLKASRMYVDLMHKQVNQTKTDLAATVSKAYFNVLILQEQTQILDANVKRLKKLRDDMKATYDNGFAEKIDYDRTVLAYNNIITEKEKLDRMVTLSVNLLKFQIGANVQDELTLTDKLEDIKSTTMINPADTIDVNNRIEMDVLQTTKRLLQIDLKLKRVAYLPSLAAFGSYSVNASRNDFDIFENKPWYRTSLVGLKLTVPVFDGFQKASRVKQARFAVDKIDNTIQSVSQGLQLEVQTARTSLINALASLDTQGENRKLAADVARITKKKFEEGVGSSLEVMDAETALKVAETNYYTALIEAYIAKVDYAKATGTLIKN